MWKFCSKICDITKFEVNLLVMLLLSYAASSVLMSASVICIHTFIMSTLEVRPAYTVKDVSTASTLVILFIAFACLYCRRSLNCFYNAYTV